MSEAQAVAPQPDKPQMSEIRRLFALLFWEPGNAFADIVKRPRWWVPMILLVACAMAYMYLVSAQVGWEQVVRDSISQSSQVQNMPAADLERLVQQQTRITSIVAPVGAVLGTPISMLLYAAVILLFFSVFLGGNAKFKEVFGVTAYAQLPGMVYAALGAIVLQLKPPEDFDIQNPVGLNIGFYLPESMPKALISFATSLDLISFWIMLLIVIGLRKIDRKASVGKAWAAVLAPWLIYVLGKTAISAMF